MAKQWKKIILSIIGALIFSGMIVVAGLVAGVSEPLIQWISGIAFLLIYFLELILIEIYDLRD